MTDDRLTKSPDLDALAAEQGVTPCRDVADLRGECPIDDVDIEYLRRGCVGQLDHVNHDKTPQPDNT
jgi:hypothetical protein